MNIAIVKNDTFCISLWRTDDSKIALNVSGEGYAKLTADEVDELIRALGKARVELSKARPRS